LRAVSLGFWPGIDDRMIELAGEHGRLVTVSDLEREPITLSAPFRCVAGFVTIKEECRRELLEVGGEMYRRCGFGNPSFTSRRDNHQHNPP
jgi:hypothetical protein